MAMDNYFTLLGFDPSPNIAPDALKSAYFAAQRATHPDKAKTDKERLQFMQLAADLNQAYQTLKNPDTRLYYLLKLQGADVLGEGAPKPSPALLMESMELRETLIECDAPEAINAFAEKIKTQITACLEKAHDAYSQNDLDGAVEAALRLRYLTKIQEEIRTKRV